MPDHPRLSLHYPSPYQHLVPLVQLQQLLSQVSTLLSQLEALRIDKNFQGSQPLNSSQARGNLYPKGKNFASSVQPSSLPSQLKQSSIQQQLPTSQPTLHQPKDIVPPQQLPFTRTLPVSDLRLKAVKIIRAHYSRSRFQGTYEESWLAHLEESQALRDELDRRPTTRPCSVYTIFAR